MKKLCMALTACFMLLTTGCAASAEPAVYAVEPTRHVSSETPNVTVEQILNEYNASRRMVELSTETDAKYTSLPVMRCACQIGNSYILFPKVEGAAGDSINSTICSAVASRAERIGIPVFADYRVEYNRHGIFSIRMFLYDMYGENESCIDCIPLTFNSETGEQFRISDFFDSENQNWRGRIPDIITAQAADCQMVLLSDILPISDDRPFYITDEAVVIMYDLYEIATYSAGEPEFEIPVDDIAECLDDASLLNAMLPEEPEEQEAAMENVGEENAPADIEQQTDELSEGEEQPRVEENAENTDNTENTNETDITEQHPEQNGDEQSENTENIQPGADADMTEQTQEGEEQSETEPAAISDEE